MEIEVLEVMPQTSPRYQMAERHECMHPGGNWENQNKNKNIKQKVKKNCNHKIKKCHDMGPCASKISSNRIILYGFDPKIRFSASITVKFVFMLFLMSFWGYLIFSQKDREKQRGKYIYLYISEEHELAIC